MTGSAPVLWEGSPQLAAVRGWARRRFAADDLDWVGVSSSPAAEAGRYTRTLADGGLPEQFHGLLGAFATPRTMREAARRAERLGEPTAWAGLDLLLVPMEYAIESRPAWWCLGTRPQVARLLLDAFGLAGVSDTRDPVLVERLLAWLPAYIPGRGCGAYARRLVQSVDRGSAERWSHFPGEDRAPVAPTRLEADRAGDAPEIEPSASPPDAPPAARALADGEVLAARPLSWYARRPTEAAPLAPTVRGGLVVCSGPAPAIAPEDGVVRLTSAEDSHLDSPPLRVVPPWTQVRFLPPARPTDEASA